MEQRPDPSGGRPFSQGISCYKPFLSAVWRTGIEPLDRTETLIDREAEDRRLSAFLKLIAKGNEAAFTHLYQATSKSIFFYLFRFLQDRDAAEDVMVEVFTAVWKGAARFEGRSKVTTWLFGIARNQALQALRKQRHHDALEDHEDLADSEAPALDESLADRESVQRALQQISPKRREVLDLVFFHNMAYGEIAELLGIPVNTVKTRVYYAKEALKHALVRERGTMP
jgi:RNA polymerase sigma-70 factor (ECF subfamily)